MAQENLVASSRHIRDSSDGERAEDTDLGAIDLHGHRAEGGVLDGENLNSLSCRGSGRLQCRAKTLGRSVSSRKPATGLFVNASLVS